MKRKLKTAKSPEPKVFTVWGAQGVEVVGLLGGQPVARCSLGGGPPSFRGEAALTRAMLEAAIEAVKRGALGEPPDEERPRGLRLP